MTNFDLCPNNFPSIAEKINVLPQEKVGIEVKINNNHFIRYYEKNYKK